MIYKTLDHWRGVAALWVMIFHGYCLFLSTPNFISENLLFLHWLSSHGWFGVHLFFVISGYCITANLAAAQDKKLTTTTFICSRLLRIFPVYWCALASQVILIVVSSPFNKGSLQYALPANFEPWFASLLLIEPYLKTSSLLLVSWSLVYEWGFYILMAAGLFMLRRRIHGNLIYLIGFLLALAGLAGYSSGLLFVLKFWPEFFAGVSTFIVCQSLNKMRKTAMILILLLLPIFLAWREGLSPRAYMMIGASGFALLLCVLYPWDAVLSSWKPLEWLGKIGVFSYSLYLIHVPFGGAFRNLCMRFVSEVSPGFLLVQIGYWVFCLFGGAFRNLCMRFVSEVSPGFLMSIS